MSVIRASCTDQLLKIVDAPVLASGGKNETKLTISFCDKWDGFTKTATFYRDEEAVFYSVMDEEDTCVVPWEVYYESGTFYIGVFGTKEGVRRTSTTVKYKVRNGAVDGLIPSDPTPDVYDQIIDMVADIETGAHVITLEHDSYTGSYNLLDFDWDKTIEAIDNNRIVYCRVSDSGEIYYFTNHFNKDEHYLRFEKIEGNVSNYIRIHFDGSVDRGSFTAASQSAYEELSSGVGANKTVLDELAEAVQAIQADLHYEVITIDTFTNSRAGTYELGRFFDSVSLYWVLNKTPVSHTITVKDSTGTKTYSIEPGTDFAMYNNLYIHTDTTYTMTVTDERGATATKETAVKFQNCLYYGVLEDGAQIDSATIMGLTKKMQATKKTSFTANPGATQRIAFALPSRYGYPVFYVNGFAGGFYKATTFDFTNAYGYTENYDLWLSDELELGETSIDTI